MSFLGVNRVSFFETNACLFHAVLLRLRDAGIQHNVILLSLQVSPSMENGLTAMRIYNNYMYRVNDSLRMLGALGTCKTYTPDWKGNKVKCDFLFEAVSKMGCALSGEVMDEILCREQSNSRDKRVCPVLLIFYIYSKHVFPHTQIAGSDSTSRQSSMLEQIASYDFELTYYKSKWGRHNPYGFRARDEMSSICYSKQELGSFFSSLDKSRCGGMQSMMCLSTDMVSIEVRYPADFFEGMRASRNVRLNV